MGIPSTKIKRVLIANRGEIAVRIIRTLRELGIESVAVYSDADASSQHRFLADFAVRLPGITSAETYLQIPRLVEAIRSSGADAVHPGYGFLSESSEFARAIEKAGAIFIGPPPEAMDRMGNKIHARNLMIEHGVPVVPGAAAPLKDAAELKKLAHEIGYPLILKAAGGGGGRGMRVVRQDSDLEPALTACQREAQAYFGNPEVFCERFIERPRHIEFQVLFDAHGNGVHLFERDCSVQRRHQKLFEEAPSSYLSPKQRDDIGAKAVAAAKAAGYVSAGTIEFICESPDRAYFMEMNTRIQVEHPVTEMITGLDLIAWQIRIAQGERLPFKQSDLQPNGWAMEARINAEDPALDFAPSAATVQAMTLPGGPFVRVDTHLYPGYKIPDTYDSMVAKVIVWAKTRPEAIVRMERALSELRLEGVQTTVPFQEALLALPAFRDGDFTTKLIEEQAAYWKTALRQAGGDSDEPTLAAVLGVVAVRHQPAAPVVDGAASSVRPSLWQEMARREGLE
ncbi:MAG: acetyl-CoA carboxylase biotin carboxylase subunit [Deltaproteobacteria bacterium]|nr:acetyl-CoA carboxylase biotin carboxylase subunit [Deltaproteobacteria bacterium]